MSYSITRRSLLLAAASGLVKAAEPVRVTLTAADGAKVFAWRYAALDSTKPAILLFHQAGSNHGEYATIAPRLVAKGHHCLALDQRSGGRMWGMANQTANALGHEAEYLEALPDLEAALAWPVTVGLPARSIVWGSSYSAALVFVLAAKHPDSVTAVLAFSPGEYLGNPHLVENAAKQVHVSVFIDTAKDEEEIAAGRILAQAAHATQFIPHIGGVHGSSTLRTDRNPKGSAENWQAVDAFLTSLHNP